LSGKRVRGRTTDWEETERSIVLRCGSRINKVIIHSKDGPGANPTIAGYSASVVNAYNSTGSLARFQNKKILFYFEKCSSLGTTTLAL
jgi:hypothetical protein